MIVSDMVDVRHLLEKDMDTVRAARLTVIVKNVQHVITRQTIFSFELINIGI